MLIFLRFSVRGPMRVAGSFHKIFLACCFSLFGWLMSVGSGFFCVFAVAGGFGEAACWGSGSAAFRL